MVIFILFFIGCDKLLEDSPQASNSSFQRKNTLLDQSKPGEHEHNIADYFYDFNDYVDVQFIYYSEPYYAGKLSTVQNPSKIDTNQSQAYLNKLGMDTLNFRTFPDFLLDRHMIV